MWNKCRLQKILICKYICQRVEILEFHFNIFDVYTFFCVHFILSICKCVRVWDRIVYCIHHKAKEQKNKFFKLPKLRSRNIPAKSTAAAIKAFEKDHLLLNMPVYNIIARRHKVTTLLFIKINKFNQHKFRIYRYTINTVSVSFICRPN